MIVRTVLKTEVRREVLSRILDGRLSAGSRVNESHLSRQLGVSRTPLREALCGLEHDGFFTVEPGRGFAVARLSGREYRELAPIMGALESAALREAGVPHPSVLAQLGSINRELARQAPQHAHRKFVLDRRWHQLLLRNCSNQHLLRLLERLRQHTQRYDIVFMHAFDVARSVRQHEHILSCLKRHKLRAACQGLVTNWTVGVEQLCRWLDRG